MEGPWWTVMDRVSVIVDYTSPELYDCSLPSYYTSLVNQQGCSVYKHYVQACSLPRFAGCDWATGQSRPSSAGTGARARGYKT